MNELSTTLKRPLEKENMANDSMALNNLCGFLNNPALTGAEAPPKSATPTPEPTTALADKTGATLAPDPLSLVTSTQAAVTKALEDLAAPAESYDRLFFTGRLCVGKDYIAKLCGAQIFGFADPLYAIAKHFFGIEVTSEKNKDVPGMRAFLQAVGQWGRGTVSEKYPYTPARALFIQSMRALGLRDIDPDNSLRVNWANYGLTDNIWLDSALERVYLAQAARVALTNVRFNNEFKRLNSEPGWTHFHVMTSAKEWADRLAKRGLKTDAPVLKDISEIMSHQLDQNVIKQISGQKTGPKIHCIWNSTTPPPSPRLWTVAEFLAACAVTPATTSDYNDLIMTE